MPHLDDPSAGHISIRLWQWLKNNDPPRRGRHQAGLFTGVDPKGIIKDIFGIGPGTRGPRRPAGGTPSGGTLNRSERVQLERQIEHQAKTQDRANRARSTRLSRDLDRREAGRVREIELARKQAQGVLSPETAAIVIGGAATAAALTAGALWLEKRIQQNKWLYRLNNEPQFAQYPNGTRFTTPDGEAYVKWADTWWNSEP